jgi:N-acetylneuraminic acid mutarotase
MKNFKQLSIVALSLGLIISACSSGGSGNTPNEPTLVGNWIKKGDFDGNGRQGASSFVIGDSAYIGTGFDGDRRFNDFWVYNVNSDSWRQRASLPGVARNTAVGFAVGTKGYITTGFDGTRRLQDNWEYDPATNAWTRRADLPDGINNPVGSGARIGAVAFNIGTKGYVVGGFNGSHQKDVWSFTPSTNTWNQEISMGGSKRQGAVAWVYNNKAYVVSGINNGTPVNDFWEYDPANATTPWKQLRNISNTSSEAYDDNYTSIIRANAVGFILGTKGYLATGENGGFLKTTWEYNFSNDTWTRLSDFERSERSGSVGFAVKGKGFVAFGRNSTFYLDNVEEFRPTDAINTND